MSIRAVFFDLGGVILRTEFQAPRQCLADRLHMDYEDIERLVFGFGTNVSGAQASVGIITEEQHWENVMVILRRPLSEYKQVRDEFFGGDVIDRELLDFLRSLRPKYKVGLISNAWSGLRAYIEREQFDNVFDHMTISAEVGMMKPDARIFQFALEQLQVRAEEAVFVDDVKANIEACEKVGMKGILFKNPASTIQKLKKIL